MSVPLRHIIAAGGKFTVCGWEMVLLAEHSRQIAAQSAEGASCPRCVAKAKAADEEPQRSLFGGAA